MLSPRFHFSSFQGPVPIGFSRIDPPPPVESKYSFGWTENGVNAAFARKKLLNYLKRNKIDSYKNVLTKLNLRK